MNRREQRIQTAIVVALKKRFDCLPWHCPNGGARTRLEAIAFREAGLTAGAPDLNVAGPGGLEIYIEVKDRVLVRERNTRPFDRFDTLDPSQKVFVERLRGYGKRVAVVESVEEAEAVCLEAGFPPKALRPARSEAAIATGF